jgi:hypothetical protein
MLLAQSGKMPGVWGQRPIACGVIVVPREKAKEVAEYAKHILEGDKEGRRGLYKQLGLPEDESVR